MTGGKHSRGRKGDVGSNLRISERRISKGIAEVDECIHIKKMFHKQSGRARKGRVRVGVEDRI